MDIDKSEVMARGRELGAEWRWVKGVEMEAFVTVLTKEYFLFFVIFLPFFL